MTINEVYLKSKMGKGYLGLIGEAYLVSFLALVTLLILWGGDSNIGSFELNINSLFVYVIAAPLVETVVFNLIIPFILNMFDAKKLTILIVCSSAFSFSHSPDIPYFHLFYFIFGWYLAVCSNRFIFGDKPVAIGILSVFAMHAIWNLLIVLASSILGAYI